ncbi:MAG: hypothetical protein LKKZDAJK_001070 [Candidatus Fervidibacter sp.]
MMFRIGDFVEVVAVNPVVQLTQVRETPRTHSLPEPLALLVDGYLVVEGANAAAMHGLLSALPQGGAFLLSGVYGTGKSHLMATLGLLAEFPDARQRFARRNPTWSPLLQPIGEGRFFVTYISLDEFDPTAFALETVVAREIASEAERKGFTVPTDPSARGEWLSAVWQQAQAKGFSGIVLLLDELAMFLNAKSGEALHRDASFLQFLAQATRRLPLLLVGALQRGVEDLQRIEPYALTQVRDRFQQTWLLNFAHALPLISQVLLRKRNEATLRQKLSDLRHQSSWAQRFSVDELFACYPLHPLTVRCLERSVGAFFSRTRSVVTFVQWSVRQHLDAEWRQLITPDTLLDHFEPDLHAHPQLRPFVQQVLPYFEARDGEVLRLIKALLAFQVGGEEPSAQKLAEALMRDAQEVWAMLERLRTEANFVDTVRRQGSPDDTYRLDPQITLTEALRRRLMETMAALTDDDPRLLRFAWECRSEEWAPPPLNETRTLVTHWQRTQRHIAITVTDLRRLTEAQLRQTVANLASPHTDECLHLFIAPPAAVDEQRRHFVQLLERLFAATGLSTASGTFADFRFAHAVVALLPRTPNEAEKRRWRENAAVWLLSQDLSLAESELGMKISGRLREMLPARQWETQRLMQRLYGDGTLLGLGTEGQGRALPMKELLMAEFVSFDELVQAVAEKVLPKVFPQFLSLAPRREASAQTLNALTRLILRGLPAPAIDANAQRWLELVALPLGILSLSQRGDVTAPMAVTAPPSELTDAILQFVGDGKPYRQVEAMMAKSPFGLTPELTQLIVAALLRVGWLNALDRNGQILPPEAISAPLNRFVATLKPAQVLSGDEWQSVRNLLTAVLDDVPETLTPERQQQLWLQLREVAKSWKLMAQDVNARLAQWQRETGQSERQWQRTMEMLHLCAELATTALQPLAAAEGLREWAKSVTALSLDAARLQSWRSDWETAAEFFATSGELLEAKRYLNALGWLPDALAKERDRLLSELRDGERLLRHWRDWLTSFRQFRNDYADAYIAHHERAHQSDAFERLQKWQQSDEVRLLTALSELPEAPEEGQEALRRLEGVLKQRCGESPLTLRPHLQRSPFCSRCGLTLDRTLSVDADAIGEAIADALARLKAWLCDEPQREKVRRFLAAAPPPDRAMLGGVLALTTESAAEQWRSVLASLPSLQKALSPFAIVEADLDELCDLLEGRYLTCHEATELFRQWLGEKTPSPETRVRFVRQDSHRSPQRRNRKGGAKSPT